MQRRTPAADAGCEPAEDERERLVAVQAEAIGARRNIVVADGAEAAAEMRAEQACLEQRQHDHDSKTEPVDRRRADQLVAEQRQRRDAGDADRAARDALPVQDHQRHDLADRKRRDRDVMSAQPERRRDQDRAERSAHQATGDDGETDGNG